ncbi:FLYWCH zinc finger domain-containing protein [Phthorimaea operculella]|nr:FLYWCH zinc finger domain-containing protein [Phthorimaea operculella]
MIGQYRFNRVNKHGVRTRWVCVKAKAGCRASLHTIDNAIVRVWGMHDPMAHTTPYRPVIQIGVRRFHRRTDSTGPRSRWNCTKSKTSINCKAFVVTVYDQITFILKKQCVATLYSWRENTGSTGGVAARVLASAGSAPKGRGGAEPPSSHNAPIFSISKFGNPLLLFGKYRFNPRHENKASYSTTRAGKPVMVIGEHRYHRHSVNRWRCNKSRSKGCKAYVTTAGDEVFSSNDSVTGVQVKGEEDIVPVMTTSRFGNPVLVFGKHRFNKNAKCTGTSGRWYCSRVSKKCKAKLFTVDNVIVSVFNEHNHD